MRHVISPLHCVLWAVGSIHWAYAGCCYSTEGQEAASCGVTHLCTSSWGVFCSVLPLPCHESCCRVVYSTCNENGCPWRTGCCWTPYEPDLTFRAWKKRKKKKKLKSELNFVEQEEKTLWNEFENTTISHSFFIEYPPHMITLQRSEYGIHTVSESHDKEEIEIKNPSMMHVISLYYRALHRWHSSIQYSICLYCHSKWDIND